MKQLRVDLVVEPGENPEQVARELIGVKGKAKLLSVRQHPGNQWPTATYQGSIYELAAIQAKSEGRPIGRPRN